MRQKAPVLMYRGFCMFRCDKKTSSAGYILNFMENRMKDKIIRATACNGEVRIFAANTTDTVQKAMEFHETSPLATVALGRALTAAALMSRELKGDKDTISIQIKGDGPLGGIVVVSDSSANVRGYVHRPQVDLPLNERGKFDVSGGLGFGYMNVIKDLGLKEPYIGNIELLSGEIAEDLTFYYAYSEQTPSIVALGVLIAQDGSVACSGGYIVQLLPEASDETVQYLEERVIGLPPVTTLISEGKTIEDIVRFVFEGKDVNIMDEGACAYNCNCSRERMERNLISIGKKELEEMIADQEGAQLQCHFCNTFYDFTDADLKSLSDLL